MPKNSVNSFCFKVNLSKNKNMFKYIKTSKYCYAQIIFSLDFHSFVAIKPVLILTFTAVYKFTNFYVCKTW